MQEIPQQKLNRSLLAAFFPCTQEAEAATAAAAPGGGGDGESGYAEDHKESADALAEEVEEKLHVSGTGCLYIQVHDQIIPKCSIW